MIRSNFQLVFSFFVLSLFSIHLHSQVSSVCDCIECPIPINDNSITTATTLVNLHGATDLSTCPLEMICLTIEHTWIGDLSISLTSPAGKNYLVVADAENNFGGCGTEEDNMEICILPGTFNPLTDKTEYICNTSPCGFGTCCLNGVWTMPCGGVNDPINNAQQAPNCDLYDFNVPGDPVNGQWILTVMDVCNQDVGTLLNFDLLFACEFTLPNACLANGGLFLDEEIVACYGNFDLAMQNGGPSFCNNPPPDTSLFDYAYFILQNDNIVAIQDEPNMISYPPGHYRIYGFSYEKGAAAAVQDFLGQDMTFVLITYPMQPYCWAASGNYVEVEILGGNLPFPCSDILVNAGDDMLLHCPDGSKLIGTSSVPSFYDCVLYTWRDLNGVLLNTDGSRTITVQGAGTYIFSFQDAFGGCVKSDTVKVLPSRILDVDAGPDTVLTCWTDGYLMYDSITATIADYSTFWKDEAYGHYYSALVPFYATHTGLYTLHGIDPYTGCRLTDQVHVTIPPTIIESVETVPAGCNESDGAAFVFLNPFATVESIAWSTGDSTQAIDGLAQGWYSVTVSDATCLYHENVFVDEDLSCKVVLSGYVYNDHHDQDCLSDSMTVGVKGLLLHLLPADIYTFTMPDGSYEFVVDAGDYTIEYIEEQVYELLCPASGIYDVSLPIDGSISQGNDFYVKKEPGQNLSVSMSFGAARAGNKVHYAFEYCNLGTESSDGVITLTLDPILNDYTLSTVADTFDAATNIAMWSVPAIQPGECHNVHFNMIVPVGTPVGTLLNGSIQIDPIDIDPHPANNTENWTQEVVASFDPNDKTTLTGDNQWGGEITGNEPFINYQINFQNTGNDTAYTVVIRDTLDENLNVESIRAGVSSHDYYLQFEGNNILIFNFENIHLPDSTTDAEASKGFVTFTIGMKEGLLPRTEIFNSAAIYFDYNAPVVTNKTRHYIPVPVFYKNVNVELCAGEFYNGEIYLNDTTFIDTVTAPLSDNIITTHIHILPKKETYLNGFICPNEFYFIENDSFSVAGNYAVNLTAANGCDSTIYLELKTGEEFSSNLNTTICEGEQYDFYGEILNTEGIYKKTLTAINGCDSSIYLELNIIENSHYSFSETICAGSDYLFNGEILNTSGIYAADLQSANGCDSIATLTLDVLPENTFYFTETICTGSEYIFNQDTLFNTGTYTAILTDNTGCDSTVILSLSAEPVIEFNFSETICESDLYIFNGDTLTTEGTYIAGLSGHQGCDSLAILNLSVLNNSAFSFSENVCEGDFYIFNNDTLYNEGIYAATFTNINGCDSTVTLNISKLENSESYVSEEICEGDFYIYNNDTISTAGFHDYIFQNQYGCDSIVHFELRTILPEFEYFSEEICEGDSLPFYGNTLSETGIYTEVFTNIYGCDSIIELTLDVISNIYMEEDTMAIYGGTIYGEIIFSDTVIIQEILQENGCYIILTTNVDMVVPNINLNKNIELSIFPNPNKGEFILKGELPKAGFYKINVFNVLGQSYGASDDYLYFNKKMERPLKYNLQAGIFYLKLTGEGTEAVIRFVVVE